MKMRVESHIFVNNNKYIEKKGVVSYKTSVYLLSDEDFIVEGLTQAKTVYGLLVGLLTITLN